jgi:hypothetical protein
VIENRNYKGEVMKFNWITDSRQKEADERKISEDLEHHGIKPCCGGEMSIDVARIGPLRQKLEGLVKCSCRKVLCDYKNGEVIPTKKESSL